MKIIQELEKTQLKKNIPNIRVGDTLKVSVKIVEGDRERTQTFSGTLISRKGKGLTETITLRRISYGEGVERIFLLHSPRIEKIEIEQEGSANVRRAKLYYLRKRIGREAQVQEVEREKETVVAKETKEVKEAKESKEVKEAKESKEAKEVKEAKESKEAKEVKEAKPTKAAK